MDSYDTTIAVTRKSLGILLEREVSYDEWHLACLRCHCVCSGSEPGVPKEVLERLQVVWHQVTFTADELQCYMAPSLKIMSNGMWRTLVRSQTVDEAEYIDEFGHREDYYEAVMAVIKLNINIKKTGASNAADNGAPNDKADV